MRRALGIILLCVLYRLGSCNELRGSPVTGSGVARPFELLIYRNPETLVCSHVSIRETQVFRNLPHEGHLDAFVTEHGDEKIQLIHSDVDFLHHEIPSLCGEEYPRNHNDGVRSSLSQPSDEQVVLRNGSPGSPINRNADWDLDVEIHELIRSGPSDNRVDFVFFSDGYTQEEKSKFLDDAMRLALDISYNQTFNTVRPLMNFWAAFTPSKETGIGVGGRPNDTPFGLYRDGTELRGVYYSKPEVARTACFSLHTQCDYPILLGNDPFYGGLGGEFTVVTSSSANGALVLRHELGHSVIDVGEEYDGGYAYFGVNAAHDVSKSIPWSHWLSNTSLHTKSQAFSKARVERSVMPMQAYPWTMLNASSAWSTTFESSGTYDRHLVRFSLSGLPKEDDLLIELDGKPLAWTPRPDIGIDRWHYDLYRDFSLSGGEHELNFTLKNKHREGIAQLCSAEILEFGNESEFISKPGHYGVYPTFSELNKTSYRPTNEDCLMRVVTVPNLCSVCREGLWLSLLRRVDLIDDARTGCEWVHSSTASSDDHWTRVFELDLVPFVQFRDDTMTGIEENYIITWAKDGEILEQFANRTRVEVDNHDSLGSYTVDVQLSTPEVRVDKDNLLATGRKWSVQRNC